MFPCRNGDFIKEVGDFDVSSLSEGEFKHLMENEFSHAEKIQLTLRPAFKRKCEEHNIKLYNFQKKHGLKPEQLSLALAFCKDETCKLPEVFPLKHYDIIQQVSNQI